MWSPKGHVSGPVCQRAILCTHMSFTLLLCVSVYHACVHHTEMWNFFRAQWLWKCFVFRFFPHWSTPIFQFNIPTILTVCEKQGTITYCCDHWFPRRVCCCFLLLRSKPTCDCMFQAFVREDLLCLRSVFETTIKPLHRAILGKENILTTW